MLWRPRHVPRPQGSKAVAPAQNKSPTGTAHRFPTARGSRGGLKGTRTGGHCYSVPARPPPHHPGLSSSVDGASASQNALWALPPLCKQIDIIITVSTTSPQRSPQFNNVIQNYSFCFQPALWCSVTLPSMFSRFYTTPLSPPPAACSFQTSSTSLPSYPPH